MPTYNAMNATIVISTITASPDIDVSSLSLRYSENRQIGNDQYHNKEADCQAECTISLKTSLAAL